jgi:acyl-CoA synthetase (AMP-forming)/AMP-acid ligase II
MLAAMLTLDENIRVHAETRGEKTALKFGDEAISYAMLMQRARRVANGLIAAGVAPGDRVAYLGKNTAAYFEYLLGAVLARAVTVPVNWRLAEPEIAYILGNCAPKRLLVEFEFEALAAKIAPDLPRLVTIAGGGSFGEWRDRQPDTPVGRKPVEQDPIVQMYTSGTTGRPKGVVLTHRNFLQVKTNCPPQHIPLWNRWTPDDVSLIAMPVAHVSGTGWAMWALLAGATGVITREFDPQAVFDLLVENRISKIILVPTAMQIAVRHPRARSTDFSFLRYIYYGAAPMPLALLKECMEVFGCGFVQMYGMTETAGTIVALPPEDHDVANPAHLNSVGKPLYGIELKIIDAAGKTLPPGQVGEIATRSAANMSGYSNMPEATAETLDAQGWLRTGDAGYLDDQGYLYLKDRVKDMIISGGENIYPAEVENAIYGHPGVSEVAVIGIADEKWGEAVKAIVVRKAGTNATAAEIIAWAAAKIAKYKLPKSVDFIDALPRNPSGKILRRELRDRYR